MLGEDLMKRCAIIHVCDGNAEIVENKRACESFSVNKDIKGLL